MYTYFHFISILVEIFCIYFLKLKLIKYRVRFRFCVVIDSMLGRPVTCQSLFDAEGLPYIYFWPDFDYGVTKVFSVT